MESKQERYTNPRDKLLVENQSLDFSFWDLADVVSLKKKEPRAGKRKPIQDSDNEEDDINKTALLNKQLAAQENSKLEDGKDKDGNDNANEEGKKNKTIIVSNSILQILQQNNIALINNDRNGPRMGNMDLVQMGSTGKQGEEAKKEGKKKKHLTLACRTLLLNNNEIRTMNALLPTLEFVMNNPAKLKWLDLSFNYLTTIESDILDFPNLKTLYLHGNYIYDLEEVSKLGNLSQLITLSLHGNPIEQIPGYRLFVIGIMFSKHLTLKKLDSVIITSKEDEDAYVWNAHIHKKMKKFPKLEDSKIKKPPQKEEDTKNGEKKA